MDHEAVSLQVSRTTVRIFAQIALESVWTLDICNFCIAIILSSQDHDQDHATTLLISKTMPMTLTLTTNTPQRFPNCDVTCTLAMFSFQSHPQTIKNYQSTK